MNDFALKLKRLFSQQAQNFRYTGTAIRDFIALAAFVLFLALCGAQAWGQTYYWTGTAGDNDWNTAANWSTDPSGTPAATNAPDTGDTAIFNDSSTSYIFAQDITVDKIEVTNGAELQFSGIVEIGEYDGDGKITTSNNLTLNGYASASGEIVIASGGALTLNSASAVEIPKITNGGALKNSGTGTLTLNDYSGTGSIENASGATLELASDAIIETLVNNGTVNATGVVTVNNYSGTGTTSGTVLKTYYWIGAVGDNWKDGAKWSATAGGSSINYYPKDANDTAIFGSDASFSDTDITVGKIEISSGAEVEFKEPFTVDEITNAGALTINSASAVAIEKITNSGAIQNNSTASLTINELTNNGSALIENNGDLTIAALTNSGAIENNGTLTITTLTILADTTVTNSDGKTTIGTLGGAYTATLDNATGTELSVNAYDTSDVPTIIADSGTIKLGAGKIDTLTVNNSTVIVQGAFEIDGDVANNGEINAGGALTVNGDFTNDGTYSGSGSTITLGGNFANNGTFDDATAAITSNGTTATIDGGANGIKAASFTCNGDVTFSGANEYGALTTAATGSVKLGAEDLVVTGTLENNGTIIYTADGRITNSSGTPRNDTLRGTVQYSGSTTLTDFADEAGYTDYFNLIIDSGITLAGVATSDIDIVVSNNLKVNSPISGINSITDGINATTEINASITTTSAQAYRGVVTIADGVTLAGSNITFGTAINNNDVTINGTANINATNVKFANDLTITAGTTTFSATEVKAKDIKITGNSVIDGGPSGIEAESLTYAPSTPSGTDSLTIKGDNTFDKFIATDIGGATLYINGTQTINTTLALAGTDESNLLIIDGTGHFEGVPAGQTATYLKINKDVYLNDDSGATAPVVCMAYYSKFSDGTTDTINGWLVVGDTVTWTGAGAANDWTDINNWNLKIVPGVENTLNPEQDTTGFKVVIPNTYGGNPISNYPKLAATSYAVKELKISGTVIYSGAGRITDNTAAKTPINDTANDGTVQYSGDTELTDFVTAGNDYANLIVDAGVTLTGSGTIVVNGTAQIGKAGAAGGAELNATSITFNDDVKIINGDATFNANVELAATKTMSVVASDGTTLASATVTFGGNFTNNGTYTASGSKITFEANFTNAGTFTDNTAEITATGKAVASGATQTLDFGTGITVKSFTYTPDTSSSKEIEINGANTFTNFTATGNATLYINDAQTISGDLTLTGTSATAPLTITGTSGSFELAASQEKGQYLKIDADNVKINPTASDKYYHATDSEFTNAPKWGVRNNWIVTSNSAEFVWIGTTDTSWSDATNWDLGFVPGTANIFDATITVDTTGSNVVIPVEYNGSTLSNFPTASATYSIGDLTICGSYDNSTVPATIDNSVITDSMAATGVPTLTLGEDAANSTTGKITVTGVLENYGKIVYADTGRITSNGTTQINDAAHGAVEYAANATDLGAVAYFNLIVDSGKTVETSNPVTVNGATQNNGTITATENLTFKGDVTNTGTIAASANVTLEANFTNDGSGAFTGTSATDLAAITASGASATITGGTGKITAASFTYSPAAGTPTLTISGDNTFTDFTVNDVNGTLTVNGTQTVSGTLTLKGTSATNVLTIGGSGSFALSTTQTAHGENLCIMATISGATITPNVEVTDGTTYYYIADNSYFYNGTDKKGGKYGGWVILADTITWTGTNSTAWNDEGNWDLGLVPGIDYGSFKTEGCNVIIPVVASNKYPIVGAEYNINDLTIGDSTITASDDTASMTTDVKLTLDSANNITVSGTLENYGRIVYTAAGRITDGADPINDNVDLANHKGTVQFADGAGTGTTHTGLTEYFNLIVDSGVTVNSATIDVKGKTENSGTLNATGNAAFTGDVENKIAGAKIDVDGAATFGGKVANAGAMDLASTASFADEVTNDTGATMALANTGSATFDDKVENNGAITAEGDLIFGDDVTNAGTIKASAQIEFKANFENSGSGSLAGTTATDLAAIKATNADDTTIDGGTGKITAASFTYTPAAGGTPSLTLKGENVWGDASATPTVDVFTATVNGATITISDANTFNGNFVVTGTTDVTLSAANTFNGKFSVTGAGGKTLTVSGTQTVTGTLTLEGTSTTALLKIAGGTSGKFEIASSQSGGEFLEVETDGTNATVPIKTPASAGAGVEYYYTAKNSKYAPAINGKDYGIHEHWIILSESMEFVWIGDASSGDKTAWDNAGNWDLGMIPGACLSDPGTIATTPADIVIDTTGCKVTIPVEYDDNGTVTNITNFPTAAQEYTVGDLTIGGDVPIADSITTDVKLTLSSADNIIIASGKKLTNYGKIVYSNKGRIVQGGAEINDTDYATTKGTVEYSGASTGTLGTANGTINYYNLIIADGANLDGGAAVTVTNKAQIEGTTSGVKSFTAGTASVVTFGTNDTAFGTTGEQTYNNTVTISGKVGFTASAITFEKAFTTNTQEVSVAPSGTLAKVTVTFKDEFTNNVGAKFTAENAEITFEKNLENSGEFTTTGDVTKLTLKENLKNNTGATFSVTDTTIEFSGSGNFTNAGEFTAAGETKITLAGNLTNSGSFTGTAEITAKNADTTITGGTNGIHAKSLTYAPASMTGAKLTVNGGNEFSGDFIAEDVAGAEITFGGDNKFDNFSVTNAGGARLTITGAQTINGELVLTGTGKAQADRLKVEGTGSFAIPATQKNGKYLWVTVLSEPDPNGPQISNGLGTADTFYYYAADSYYADSDNSYGKRNNWVIINDNVKYIWIGATDNNWATDSNWFSNIVPGVEDSDPSKDTRGYNVIIPVEYVYYNSGTSADETVTVTNFPEVGNAEYIIGKLTICRTYTEPQTGDPTFDGLATGVDSMDVTATNVPTITLSSANLHLIDTLTNYGRIIYSGNGRIVDDTKTAQPPVNDADTTHKGTVQYSAATTFTDFATGTNADYYNLIIDNVALAGAAGTEDIVVANNAKISGTISSVKSFAVTGTTTFGDGASAAPSVTTVGDQTYNEIEIENSVTTVDFTASAITFNENVENPATMTINLPAGSATGAKVAVTLKKNFTNNGSSAKLTGTNAAITATGNDVTIAGGDGGIEVSAFTFEPNPSAGAKLVFNGNNTVGTFASEKTDVESITLGDENEFTKFTVKNVKTLNVNAAQKVTGSASDNAFVLKGTSSTPLTVDGSGSFELAEEQNGGEYLCVKASATAPNVKITGTNASSDDCFYVATNSYFLNDTDKRYGYEGGWVILNDAMVFTWTGTGAAWNDAANWDIKLIPGAGLSAPNAIDASATDALIDTTRYNVVIPVKNPAGTGSNINNYPTTAQAYTIGTLTIGGDAAITNSMAATGVPTLTLGADNIVINPRAASTTPLTNYGKIVYSAAGRIVNSASAQLYDTDYATTKGTIEYAGGTGVTHADLGAFDYYNLIVDADTTANNTSRDFEVKGNAQNAGTMSIAKKVTFAGNFKNTGTVTGTAEITATGVSDTNNADNAIIIGGTGTFTAKSFTYAPTATNAILSFEGDNTFSENFTATTNMSGATITLGGNNSFKDFSLTGAAGATLTVNGAQKVSGKLILEGTDANLLAIKGTGSFGISSSQSHGKCIKVCVDLNNLANSPKITDLTGASDVFKYYTRGSKFFNSDGSTELNPNYGEYNDWVILNTDMVFIWKGGVSTAWNEPSNWNLGIVPGLKQNDLGADNPPIDTDMYNVVIPYIWKIGSGSENTPSYYPDITDNREYTIGNLNIGDAYNKGSGEAEIIVTAFNGDSLEPAAGTVVPSLTVSIAKNVVVKPETGTPKLANYGRIIYSAAGRIVNNASPAVPLNDNVNLVANKGTVIYNGSATQTFEDFNASGADYYNLVIETGAKTAGASTKEIVVENKAIIKGELSTLKSLEVSGNAEISGTISFVETLEVTGTTLLNTANVTTTASQTYEGAVTVSGASTLETKDITFNEDVAAAANLTVTNSGLLLTADGKNITLNGGSLVQNGTGANSANQIGGSIVTNAAETATFATDVYIYGNTSSTFGSGTGAFTLSGDLHIAPSAASTTKTIASPLTAQNIILYSGTVNANANLTTTQDLVLLGAAYDAADNDEDAADSDVTDLFTYQHSARTDIHAAPSYTGAFKTQCPDGTTAISTPYSGKLNVVSGKTITVGKNFYGNGVAIEGAGTWNLIIPDNDSQASAFAELYNSSIKNCYVTGGVVAAAENCTTITGCTNVFNTRPLIAQAYTVSDDIIFVSFGYDTDNDGKADLKSDGTPSSPAKIENSENEIWAAVSQIKYLDNNGNLVAFTGTFTDVKCTTSTNDKTDRSSFYIKAANKWNTDATGVWAGTEDSTDNGGTKRKAIPCIDIIKASTAVYETLRDSHKNRIAQYHSDAPSTPGTLTNTVNGMSNTPGATFTMVEDHAAPVLIAAYTGQEKHTNGDNPSAQKDYDAHNFIEFRYSEPVLLEDGVGDDIFDESRTTLKDGHTNVRANATWGNIPNGGVDVAGLGSIANGKVTAGIKNTASAGSPHSLYVDFKVDGSSKNNYETRCRVRVSIAGYVEGTVAVNGFKGTEVTKAPKNWVGWIDSPNTSLPTGKVDATSAIGKIKDRAVKADGTTLIKNGFKNINTGITISNVNSGVYGAWDITPPSFAPMRINGSTSQTWASFKTPDPDRNYEILGFGNGTTLDVVEFHMFDNAPTYNESVQWFSRIGWATVNTSTNTYDSIMSATADILGGSRGEYDNEAAGGIRASSLYEAKDAFTYDNAASSTHAFTAARSSAGSDFYTSVVGATRRPPFAYDTNYFGLKLDKRDLTAEQADFDITFDSTKCYITDLAGNRIQCGTIKLKSIDRTPPSFSITATPIGTNKMLIVFADQLNLGTLTLRKSGDSTRYERDALESIPKALKLTTSSGTGIQIDQNVPAQVAFANEKSTGLIITLTQNAVLTDITQGVYVEVIRNTDGFDVDMLTGTTGAAVTYIQDFTGNFIKSDTQHAISDFAINAIQMQYAYAVTDPAAESEPFDVFALEQSWSIARNWDKEQTSDGSVKVGKEIIMNGYVYDGTSDNTGGANAFDNIQVFFAHNPPQGSVSTIYNFLTGMDLRVWLPKSFKSISEVDVPLDYTAENVPLTTTERRFFNVVIPEADSKAQWHDGNQVKFLFQLGNYTVKHNGSSDANAAPLYCLRLKNPADITSLDLWSFITRNATLQRGGVTILNNVINVDAGERTTVQVQTTSPKDVKVMVMTLDGNIVKYLQPQPFDENSYYYLWDGKNKGGTPVARGLYFIRVIGPGFDETRKVMCVK